MVLVILITLIQECFRLGLVKTGQVIFRESESIKMLRNGGQTKWDQKACSDELKHFTTCKFLYFSISSKLKNSQIAKIAICFEKQKKSFVHKIFYICNFQIDNILHVNVHYCIYNMYNVHIQTCIAF